MSLLDVRQVDDLADGYGVYIAVLTLIGTAIAWTFKIFVGDPKADARERERAARAEARENARVKDEKERRDEIFALIANLQNSNAVNSAFLEYFREISADLKAKIQQVGELVSAIEALARKLLQEISREKDMKPVFVAKVDRLESELATLKRAVEAGKELEEHLRVQLEEATSLRDGFQTGRWSEHIGEAQFNKLERALTQVSSSKASAAALEAAKAARLKKGAKFREMMRALNDVRADVEDKLAARSPLPPE